MWFFLILFLAIALIAGGIAAYSFVTGEPLSVNFFGPYFGPKPERRLGVIEQTSVDNRRKLILIRRDGVEHLIMTGGPVDVVIETGIGAPTVPQAAARAIPRGEPDAMAPTATVFQRPTRALGSVVNE